MGSELRIWDLRRGDNDDDRTKPHGRGPRRLAFSAVLEFNYLKARRADRHTGRASGLDGRRPVARPPAVGRGVEQLPAPPLQPRAAGQAAKTSSSHDIRSLSESVPDSLSITNGVAHSAEKDRWAGTVSAQGSVVIRNRRAMLARAHIDPDGTIRGEYHG
jgi:hypothetical protein